MPQLNPNSISQFPNLARVWVQVGVAALNVFYFHTISTSTSPYYHTLFIYIDFVLLVVNFSFKLMPTISECQLLIHEILHVVDDLEQISHISRMAVDGESADKMQSSDSSRSEFSLSSSSSSSTDSTSSSESGSEGFMSVDSTDRDTDSDEERTIFMGMTGDLLLVIMETHIFNPHLVAKCSQLDLILVNFKFHDPKRFRLNLRVSSSTFDCLLEMIETHTIFLNDTNTVAIKSIHHLV